MAKYIERDAALKALHEEWDDVCNYDGSGYAIANEMENVIYSVPAADVRPVVHGRWEREEDTYFGFTDVEHRCSHCGKAYSGQGFCAFHFCPNCGAKMDLI